MKRLLNILKWVYVISQGIVVAFGFYFVALILITVLNGTSLFVSFDTQFGRATANLDMLTKGVNGIIISTAGVFAFLGAITLQIVSLVKFGKKLVYRIKNHEDSKSAKTLTKEA